MAWHLGSLSRTLSVAYSCLSADQSRNLHAKNVFFLETFTESIETLKYIGNKHSPCREKKDFQRKYLHYLRSLSCTSQSWSMVVHVEKTCQKKKKTRAWTIKSSSSKRIFFCTLNTLNQPTPTDFLNRTPKMLLDHSCRRNFESCALQM